MPMNPGVLTTIGGLYVGECQKASWGAGSGGGWRSIFSTSMGFVSQSLLVAGVASRFALHLLVHLPLSEHGDCLLVLLT